jgi:hypothetical protein
MSNKFVLISTYVQAKVRGKAVGSGKKEDGYLDEACIDVV